MPITTALKIAEHCLLDTDPAGKVFTYADQAEAKLRFLLTSETYDEVKAEGAGQENFDNLQRAESYLSLYFALPFLNLRPTELGGLSKIIGYGEHQTEQLMGLGELKGYRGRFYEMAIGLLEDIREQVPEDPEDFKEAGIDSYDAGPFTIG